MLSYAKRTYRVRPACIDCVALWYHLSLPIHAASLVYRALATDEINFDGLQSTGKRNDGRFFFKPERGPRRSVAFHSRVLLLMLLLLLLDSPSYDIDTNYFSRGLRLWLLALRSALTTSAPYRIRLPSWSMFESFARANEHRKYSTAARACTAILKSNYHYKLTMSGLSVIALLLCLKKSFPSNVLRMTHTLRLLVVTHNRSQTTHSSNLFMGSELLYCWFAAESILE